MSANHASIKLSRDLVEEARKEAEVLHRSVSAQVEHWAKLGRALENASGMDLRKVRAVLEGQLKLEDLSALEQNAFYGGVFGNLNAPDAAMRDAYAALGARDGAVGTDGRGGVLGGSTARRRRVA